MSEAATSASEREDDQRRSKDAGLYLYSRLAASVLGLVTIALAKRFYPDADFAYVAGLLLLYDTAYALGSLGLPEAVFYFVGRDHSRAPIVVRQATFLLAAVALPVIGIVAIAAYLLSSASELNLVPALPWLALALLFAMPTQPAINQLIAAKRAATASKLQTFYAFATALAFLLPLLLGLPITWAPIFLVASTSLRLAIHLLLMRRVFPRAPGGPPWLVGGELRAMLAYAFPAGVASLCGKLNPQIDKYVVALMLSTSVFALYTAAAYELPLISMIPYAVGAVMQVRYVELYAAGRVAELRDLWFANVRKVSTVVFPVTVFVLVIAPELIELLFGRATLGATLPFQLFTAVLLHRVASYGAMLQATGQTRSLLVSSVLLVATNAVLTVPLTWALGSSGAALATLLANVPPWLWTLSRIGGAMQTGIAGSMPWRDLARGLLVTLAIGAGLWLLKGQLAWPASVRLAVTAVAFAALYIPIARVVGMISASDLAYLGRWLSFRVASK